MATSFTISQYKIGIICALSKERIAVEAMFDAQHGPGPQVNSADRNSYSCGKIGPYNVVVTSLDAGEHGLMAASSVAHDMRTSFPHLRLALLVGIAGGVPRPESPGGDIRLGDVVVGCAKGGPSIINCEKGKHEVDGFEIRSDLPSPPPVAQRAISALQAKHVIEGPTYLNHLLEMLKRKDLLNDERVSQNYFNHPGKPDDLFKADFTVEHATIYPRDEGKIHRGPRTLSKLDKLPFDTRSAPFITRRYDGSVDYPQIHYGTIASSDALIKSGVKRDEIAARVRKQRDVEILAFEMEAAGVVKDMPFLVIRGICDYCDSHKNDDWQNFAAAMAAAYAKDLLAQMAPEAIDKVEATSDNGGPNSGTTSHQYSSKGPMNVNSGSGSQTNSSQIGGRSNRQFNSAGGAMNFGAGFN